MKGLREKKLNYDRSGSSSEEEFIKLYKALHGSLMSYGMRICSNEELTRDSIHEVFLEVWEKNEKFSSIKEIKPYLFRCLRNILIDNFRQQRSFLRDEPGELGLNSAISEDKPFSLSQEDLIIEKESEDESKKLIGRFINKLSERQKEIFYLKFYDGLSNKEISEVTGIHYQSVRNIIFEGIKRIRDFNMELYIILIGIVCNLFL